MAGIEGGKVQAKERERESAKEAYIIWLGLERLCTDSRILYGVLLLIPFWGFYGRAGFGPPLHAVLWIFNLKRKNSKKNARGEKDREIGESSQALRAARLSLCITRVLEAGGIWGLDNKLNSLAVKLHWAIWYRIYRLQRFRHSCTFAFKIHESSARVRRCCSGAWGGIWFSLHSMVIICYSKLYVVAGSGCGLVNQRRPQRSPPPSSHFSSCLELKLARWGRGSFKVCLRW